MSAQTARRPVTALALIFFLSGAAALLFETLWFRLTGLTFGNTAWASAIVLAAFMAGLAIGNALAARFRFARTPLRVYAVLEMAIAISALALVLGLPLTQRLFAPFFAALPSEWSLNAARLLLAFVLMVIPTTLMGATLPTAVGALSSSEDDFGRILGLLYGMNTLGAVAGSLAGEVVLIRLLGVRGTGVAAAACSAAASIAAFVVARSAEDVRPKPGGYDRLRLSGTMVRYLLAAAGAGFALLALEVAWFRFLILFNFSSSLAFTVMLAVVLLGIGGGALAGSIFLRSRPDGDSFASIAAAAAGIAMVLCYWGFAPSFVWKARPGTEAISVLIDAVRLMLPVSALSGFFFTLIGKAVEREVGDDTRAAALLTCSNTIGAALGSVAAGFLLVPRIGVERTFFAIAVAYAAVALLSLRRDPHQRRSLVVAAVLAAGIVFFPLGTFHSTFVPAAVQTYLDPGTSIAAVREGMLETAVLLRSDVAGEPYLYKLFTNGYSMSGTGFASKRYMSLFVHLPIALQPSARSALLISYGVGTTATALVEQSQLASIDVVDPSRNILDLSATIHPGSTNPLLDSRVRVHVEDGRFFLLTTKRRFDLITAEPPPPKSAGIVSLYTLEYFRLLHDRLTEHGVATYWLPVYQLNAPEAKSVVAAFCGAFSDCSLWSGAGGEWILAGTRGGVTPPESSAFARQWSEDRPGTRLRWIGIEQPAQLAATFLADAGGLRTFARGIPPLTDDHPLRLSSETVLRFAPDFEAIMRDAPRAYASSRYAEQVLPADIRAAATPLFDPQQMADQKLRNGGLPEPRVLATLLETTNLRTLPRLLLGSDMWLEGIARRARARGDQTPPNSAILGIGALAERDYARAELLLGSAADAGFPSATPYAIVSAFLAGHTDAARARIAALPPASPWRDPKKWAWATQ